MSKIYKTVWHTLIQGFMILTNAMYCRCALGFWNVKSSIVTHPVTCEQPWIRKTSVISHISTFSIKIACTWPISWRSRARLTAFSLSTCWRDVISHPPFSTQKGKMAMEQISLFGLSDKSLRAKRCKRLLSSSVMNFYLNSEWLQKEFCPHIEFILMQGHMIMRCNL